MSYFYTENTEVTLEFMGISFVFLDDGSYNNIILEIQNP